MRDTFFYEREALERENWAAALSEWPAINQQEDEDGDNLFHEEQA